MNMKKTDRKSVSQFSSISCWCSSFLHFPFAFGKKKAKGKKQKQKQNDSLY